jgi:predicted nucleic acid-binding protein
VILADTSVWADHLRHRDLELGSLLENGALLMHPFVLGEIALGYLRNRAEWLQRLNELPGVEIAHPEEVLQLIEHQNLMGSGVGYIDAHLLAAGLNTPDCLIWTRDKAFGRAATRLGIAAKPIH